MCLYMTKGSLVSIVKKKKIISILLKGGGKARKSIVSIKSLIRQPNPVVERTKTWVWVSSQKRQPTHLN